MNSSNPVGKDYMSLRSRLLLFFPLFMMLSFGTIVGFSYHEQNGFYFVAAILFLYLFPVFCFHLNRWGHPLREIYRISDPSYNVWWGGHQIQMIFISFPFLETILRLIPGAYSFWLRLWGAKIGKNIYWTPHVEILDRNLIEIGDNVVFGHLVKVASHVVTPRKGSITLFVKSVKFGAGSFIGAGTVLGPGTEIESKAVIPAGSSFFNGKLV